jgi:diapolycopene oxygenase
MKTAIVIGSGAGGLSSALLLQAHGWQVTLLERNEVPGGKLGLHEENGFKFDTGPTILTLPGILKILFRESGADVNDYLTFVDLDPEWRCFFEDGSTFELHHNEDAQLEEVRRISPDDVDGFKKLLRISDELYDLSQENFFFRNVGSVGDIMKSRTFDLSSLALVRTLRPWQTYASLIHANIQSPQIRQTLEHLVQYVGSSPFKTPAIFGLMMHVQLRKGCWYPMGGMNTIAKAIAMRFTELGGVIKTGEELVAITRSKTRASEVTTRSGNTYTADQFVFNTDLNVLQTKILLEQPSKRPQSCSGVVIFAGVNKPLPKLAHHNFFFSHTSEREFGSIYSEGLPAEDLTAYLCAASKTDPGVAPNGMESLYFLIHTPALNGKTDWKEFIKPYRDKIYEKCERMLGERFSGNIIAEKLMTPEYIESRFGTYNGNIYGFASHGKLHGGFKERNRLSGFENVWLAGGTVNPGAGVPMSLMSGMIVGGELTGTLEHLQHQEL